METTTVCRESYPIDARQLKAAAKTIVLPSADQPGTLGQQLDCIDLFLANPFRRIDRAAAWELSRRLVLGHKRRAAA
jgi:hypothetical protein